MTRSETVRNVIEEFDLRRAADEREYDARLAELSEKIPGFGDITHALSSIGLRILDAAMKGGDTASAVAEVRRETERLRGEDVYKRQVPCTVENNYTDHVSRTVTPEMIATASQVIGISSRHAMALICAFPGQAEKISAMPEDIADPFGGTVDDYVRCLADIEKSLRAMFGEK